MQLFSADATIFKNKSLFFAHKKLKKPPSKVAQKNSYPLFFLTAWAAQTAQTEEFMFQNVAYRLIVYRTGAVVDFCWVFLQANLVKKVSFLPIFTLLNLFVQTTMLLEFEEQ